MESQLNYDDCSKIENWFEKLVESPNEGGDWEVMSVVIFGGNSKIFLAPPRSPLLASHHCIADQDQREDAD